MQRLCAETSRSYLGRSAARAVTEVERTVSPVEPEPINQRRCGLPRIKGDRIGQQRSVTETAQRPAMVDVMRQKSAAIIVVVQVVARRRVKQRNTRSRRSDLGIAVATPDGGGAPANKPNRALNQDETKWKETS